MGCASSSNPHIPASLGFKNKRGGSAGKGGKRGETDIAEMSALKVPEIYKNDKLSVPVGSSTGNPRNKVALKPGRSMIDWMKFHRSAPDPSGTGGKMIKVTREELAKHNKEDDAWMALNGKVYNVTSYMEYHPGGIPELLRGCGIDGTDLFNEVHRWVNYESMLKRCCVGVLDTSVSDRLKASTANSQPIIMDFDRPNQDSEKLKKPRYSWSQKGDVVTITVMTFYDNIQPHHIAVDKNQLNIIIHVIIKNQVFVIDINFEDDVHDKYKITKSQTVSGEVDVVFTKVRQATFWSVLGVSNPGDGQWKAFSVSGLTYRSCMLAKKTRLTPDTRLFQFLLPLQSFCVVPVGCHVFVRASVDGFPIVKPYTAVPLSPCGCPGEANEGGGGEGREGRTVNFIIKIYQDGVLTPVLDRLNEGDQLDVSCIYAGTSFEEKLNLSTGVSRMNLIAAGTGITPMISVLNHLDKSGSNKQRSVQLLFFNKSEEDIIWRKEFETFSKKHPWLTFTSILSHPSDNWKGQRGKIDRRHLMNSIPTNVDGSFFCVCGPTPFTQATCDLLHDLSVADAVVHAFNE